MLKTYGIGITFVAEFTLCYLVLQSLAIARKHQQKLYSAKNTTTDHE